MVNFLKDSAILFDTGTGYRTPDTWRSRDHEDLIAHPVLIFAPLSACCTLCRSMGGMKSELTRFTLI